METSTEALGIEKSDSNLQLAGWVLLRLASFAALMLLWGISLAIINSFGAYGFFPIVIAFVPLAYVGHIHIYKKKGGKIAMLIVLGAIAALGMWAAFLR